MAARILTCLRSISGVTSKLPVARGWGDSGYIGTAARWLAWYLVKTTRFLGCVVMRLRPALLIAWPLLKKAGTKTTPPLFLCRRSSQGCASKPRCTSEGGDGSRVVEKVRTISMEFLLSSTAIRHDHQLLPARLCYSHDCVS